MTTLSIEAGTTLEERVSRLEAGYEHLATKADVADLRAEFKTDIASLRSEVQRSDAATQAAFAEMQRRDDAMQAAFEKLRTEMQARDAAMQAAFEKFRTEMQARDEVMRAEMNARDAAMREEISTRDAAMRDEIRKIRTDNAENRARIIQWAVGAIIAVAAVATTIGVALTRSVGG